MALGPRRAVVLRALGLGDLLTAVPALRGLRTALPSHRLVLAAPAALAPLVSLAGAVDELLPTIELEPLPWQGDPPDIAVNLHGKGPRSHRVLQALGPGRLVGFHCGEAGQPGPEWRSDEHEVRRWRRLVEESFAVPVDPDALDLVRPATPSGWPGAVVVHPGAAYLSRRWPPDRFVAVTRWLAEHGRHVVVTGSETEKPLVSGIVAAAGLARSADLSGCLDLEQLAALVSASALVVCGDTGVAHLATAYGRPSVVLFGPVSPQLWGPPDRPEHVVLWHGDGRGDPWGSAVDPALMAITPDEVIEAAAGLLSRPG